jgi:hypothetical protein
MVVTRRRAVYHRPREVECHTFHITAAAGEVKRGFGKGEGKRTARIAWVAE